MSAPIEYLPCLVLDHVAAFAALRDELPWTRVASTPRRECYFNDAPVPYTYGTGRGRRTYLPEETWHPIVLNVRRELEAYLTTVLDVCFCNMDADQHEQLGWHADDSPDMDDARPIVTVSFGAAREIWLRPRRGKTTDRVLLEPGSALIMLPGMQDAWDHRIPKHDRPCGPRISLTFRGYVTP